MSLNVVCPHFTSSSALVRCSKESTVETNTQPVPLSILHEYSLMQRVGGTIFELAPLRDCACVHSIRSYMLSAYPLFPTSPHAVYSADSHWFYTFRLIRPTFTAVRSQDFHRVKVHPRLLKPDTLF